MSYSLAILEFEKLLEIVSRNAETPMGRALFADLEPKAGRLELEADLAAITETIFLNEEKQAAWAFSGVPDAGDAIAKLRIRGAALEPMALLIVARLCSSALAARAVISPERNSAPTLWKIVEPVPPALGTSIAGINRKLLPGGEIDDSASSELARIRRDIAGQRSRITKSLEAVIRFSGDAIQDKIVTLRNDRFVIPVKSDFRGKVGGVAHGFSSSGATVFVEPFEAIEANNELQNLKGKEERETARILAALSDELREHLSSIEAAEAAVAELDFINAKVKFARSFDAVVPEISNDEVLDLTDARHPVLEENLRCQALVAIKEKKKNTAAKMAETAEIVPSSFSLTGAGRVMIISGANAGGKTVVLKTAGLLSLMALAGLPVPAKAARIPFYRSVLADIGDHQSISANLSTFSSHMSNIGRMMRDCQTPALVLLDEAGTGTDPDEGSALGVAIVDYFRKKGAHVMASTHYRGLKIYAANDESVINASVEFDEKSLLPTYRLLIGTAGASSGFEIAERFGIRRDVIESARAEIGEAARKAESYLQTIQTESRRAKDLRRALEEEREAVAIKYAGLEVEAAQKEKARQKQFEKELAETIEAFDRQSRAFLDSLEQKALKNKLEKERAARKAELNRAIVAKMRAAGPSPELGIEISKSEPDTANRVPQAAGPLSAPDEAAQPRIGARVATFFGKIGTIEKIDKDTAEVMVGGMRLREKLADLRVVTIQPAVEQQRNARNLSTSRPVDTPDASAELNLIGKTTSEAEYELDRFIDEAYMASLPRVRIIHGFGTGALKNFVHHFLKNHELVESFSFASSGEGGNGATIAEIKS